MRLDDLAVFVLHQIHLVAVQHADLGIAGERCRMLAAGDAVTARFHADDLHTLFFDVGIEHADGIGAAGPRRRSPQSG